MEKDKDSAINFFKEKIIRIYKPLKIAQIGSNRKVKDKTDDYDCKSDFDMIVVVDDKLDCYEYMKQISSVIKQVLIDFDIIINAYPIRECVYQKGMSEFLDNVRKNAIIIWEN